MSNLITPQQLADRWHMSNDTLTNWRVKKQGPAYMKLGQGRASKVMYRLADVEAFEEIHMVKGLTW